MPPHDINTRRDRALRSMRLLLWLGRYMTYTSVGCSGVYFWADATGRHPWQPIVAAIVCFSVLASTALVGAFTLVEILIKGPRT